jgi:hypothetical protein
MAEFWSPWDDCILRSDSHEVFGLFTAVETNLKKVSGADSKWLKAENLRSRSGLGGLNCPMSNTHKC